MFNSIKLLLLLSSFFRVQNTFAETGEIYPKGFQLVQKRGSNFQVVIIGDTHGAPGEIGESQIENFRRGAPIVAEMGRPGDLILVEVEDRRDRKFALHDVIEKDHPLRILSNQFQIGGWDNMELASYAKGYYELALAHFGSPRLDDHVRASFYMKLFYAIGIRDRNRSMIQAIEKAQGEGFERIFIFAGTHHVVDSELTDYLMRERISHLILGRELEQIRVEEEMMTQEMREVYLEFGENNFSKILELEKRFVTQHRQKILEKLGGIPEAMAPRGARLSCKSLFSLGY